MKPPATITLRKAKNACTKPHGLPCLQHRLVIQGQLKPCDGCGQLLPKLQPSMSAIITQESGPVFPIITRQKP